MVVTGETRVCFLGGRSRRCLPLTPVLTWPQLTHKALFSLSFKFAPTLPAHLQALAEADRYYLSDTYKREVGTGVG